ncbi:hypothetical protein KC316_g9443 [Hortaea werneckii]|nr:hypothetical protein KC334_g11868 [Hortaea werneckii]KAI7198130.1 hypothetical protein KC324_g3980 [Hortaea werneckii]KAI7579442.1 hypothetical protein KC316_g9443 [Hortaea werneckii]
MVLEGATSADTSFGEDAPPSDIDPYANSNTSYLSGKPTSFVKVTPDQQQHGVYINLNELPRRWSIVGQKAHPQMLVDGISEQVKFSQGILQRPIKQDEANALAFHFAKSLRIASYGTPIGVLGASAMVYRTQKDMRFPGWAPFKEGSRFSKDAFGPLRGQMARLAWQMSRISAYWFIGATIGQIFFGSYALSVSLAGRAMDPRLKDFTEALKRRQQSGVGRQATGQVGNQEEGPKGTETFEMARQRSNAQTSWGRRRAEASGEQGDDASPTGGMFNDEFLDSSSEQPGFMSEDQVKQQADSRLGSERSQRPQSGPYEQSSAASRQSAMEGSSPWESDRQTPSQTSGSAWDRLRQGAMSNQGGEPRRPSRGMQSSDPSGSRPQGGFQDAAPSGDGYTFSSSDEERQLAKSQQQQEFDALIDRERGGVSQVEGDNRRGRW